MFSSKTVLQLGMPLILYGGILDIMTNTCFMRSAPHFVLFSSAFNIQNVFDVTDRTPRSSHFCIQVTEELYVDCNIIVFIMSVM